jgi:hypothetical protein
MRGRNAVRPLRRGDGVGGQLSARREIAECHLDVAEGPREVRAVVWGFCCRSECARGLGQAPSRGRHRRIVGRCAVASPRRGDERHGCRNGLGHREIVRRREAGDNGDWHPVAETRCRPWALRRSSLSGARSSRRGSGAGCWSRAPGRPVVPAPGGGGSAEALRELAHDARGERVGHVEDVAVDGFVVANVGGEPALETVLSFVERLVEMDLHHRTGRRA